MDQSRRTRKRPWHEGCHLPESEWSSRAQGPACEGGCPDSAVRAATSVRFFRDGLTVSAALSIRGCRIGDRIRQRFGETAVAPVVHMQAIRRERYLERDAVDVVPVPHEGEAVKHVDVLLLGRARNELDHVRNFRLCDHLRRELRIDQNHIGADGLYSLYTFVD